MTAKYILAGLAVLFLAAAAVRLLRGTRVSHPQVRTWILVAFIFAAVSAWLFSRT